MRLRNGERGVVGRYTMGDEIAITVGITLAYPMQ
jgi:hypothetical protein